MTSKIPHTSQPVEQPQGPRTDSLVVERTALLVLGMHRSGTSAVTRVLSLLGADLPSNLIPPMVDNNEPGFWESQEVFQLNDDILQSAGSRWDDWREFNPGWVKSPASQLYRAGALEFLERDFSESPLFVLKDPRICRLLPFWLDLLVRFNAVVKCVLPIRNPIEIAASLRKRDDFSPAKSHVLWLRHVLEAEKATRHLHRVFLSYDDTLDDWRAVVAHVGNRLDLTWPRRSATADVEIDRFLNPRHRHHVTEDKRLQEHPEIAAWVKEVYAILSELALDPIAETALHRLDAIRSEFNRASDTLGAVVRAEEMAREEAEHQAVRKAEEAATFRIQLEARDEQLKELRKVQERTIEELRTALSNRNERIGTLEQVSRDLESENAALKATLDDRGGRINELEQIVAEHKTMGKSLRTSVREREVQVEALQRDALARKEKLLELEHLESSLRTQCGNLLDERNQALHRLNAIQSGPRRRPNHLSGLLARLAPLDRQRKVVAPGPEYCGVKLQRPERLRLQRQAKQFLAKGVFDAVWYVETYPEIVLKGWDPLWHWLVSGWREGYQPHPLFDTEWYLQRYPDVAKAGVNPLAHYLKYGGPEGREPSPVFNGAWYLEQNPDVREAGVNPLLHYLSAGAKEGRDPNPMFDTDWYLEKNQDVRNDGMNALVHFMRYGAAESRKPHPDFDIQAYKKEHPEIVRSGENPLAHYFHHREKTSEHASRIFEELISSDALEGASNKAPRGPYELWRRLNRGGPNRLSSLAIGAGLIPRGTTEKRAVTNQLQGLLTRVDTVTFDLFDTLIERTVYEPADVFRIVGLKAPSVFTSYEAYALARIAAEKNAREKSTHQEVTLDEIMSELRLAHDLSADELEALYRAELNVERRVIGIKPEGKELFDTALSAGHAVYILTDSYLPRAFIEDLLRACDLSDHGGLYVSCELRVTKHHGSMFERWLEEPGHIAQQTLHVGDNPHSDGDVPRAKGFYSLGTLTSRDRFLRHPKNANLWSADAMQQLPQRLMFGVIANRYGDIAASAKIQSQYLGSPYVLGFAALGPLLLGFTANLIEFARRRNISTLCFLSRDGYLMKAAYDLAAASTDDPPRSAYLAASRALCSSAGVDSPERIDEIASIPHFPMSIGDMLRMRFGFCREEVEAIPASVFAKHGMKGSNHVVSEADPAKRAFLKDLASQIIEISFGRATRYREYLNSLDIDYSTAAVVDIGYAASAQRVMSRLLNTAVEGIYLITSERAEKLKAENLHCEAWLGESVPLSHPFFTHVQLWEMFLSASHGSVLDVESAQESSINLQLDANLFDESVRANLAVVHRGALDFVAKFLDQHRDVFGTANFAADLCSAPLSTYFCSPDGEDCVAFAKAVFEDGFGGDIRLLAMPGIGKAMELASFKKEIVWHEASTELSSRTTSPTPFYPASPVSIARLRGNLGEAPSFIDGIDRVEITPSWSSSAYRAVFDSNGWPMATATKAQVRLVLPIMRMDEVGQAVLASYRDQVFGGLDLLVAYFSDVAAEEIHQALEGVHAEAVPVSTWDEVTRLAARCDEPWVVLNDGHTALDSTFSAELANVLRGETTPDIVIVDDDWFKAGQDPANPHFKPQWSPELLLCTNYFGGAFAIRTALLREVSSRSDCGSAWIWELALTLAGKTDRITRISRILAHRSIDANRAQLPQAQPQAQAAVASKFQEMGVNARVEIPNWAQTSNRLACQPQFPDDGPSVAVIIPTKNQHEIVKRCIDSLKRTTYRNYRVYLVDNESDDADALAYFATLEAEDIRLLRVNNPSGNFSYSYVNNRAVEQTNGEELLLFLNNDTEVIAPRWLSQMVGWQRVPGVGSVGARLLFPNRTIQHAGITHRLLYNVLPAPSFKCLPGEEGGYQDYILLSRDSAAQTAACLLTPRDVLVAHGMFDETHFGVAYNDCDYGFKLTQAGLRNVYCGDAVLYHHEGYSRGVGRGNDKPSEEAAFVRKYANWIDPYYNPNLAVGQTDFAVRPTAPITSPVPVLRLAMVSHNLEHEGAPKVLMEIALGLKKAGTAEITVLSPLDGPLRVVYEQNGCRVEIVSGSAQFFWSDRAGLDAISRVALRLAELRIDVVFANTVLSWWAVEAAALIHVPSIWLIHESEPPFTHLAEHNDLCAERGKRALAFPYRVGFVSYATRDVFAHLETKGNFDVFHNGFDASAYLDQVENLSKEDARRELGLPEDTVVGLLPGSVCERKSQIDLVRAVKLLDTRVASKTTLIILGDRPSEYSTRLHAEIATLDPVIREVIKVLPYASNAERYFRATDFLISTSRIEAFPRIVQEAMCFALPMIVAPVFGVTEQVADEVSALFFPPGDAPRLAAQIERMATDSELLAKLGENAKATLGRFPTMSEMIEHYTRTVQEAWLSCH